MSIEGGSTNFAGDGTYDVSAGADVYIVKSKVFGAPETSAVEDLASDGLYDVGTGGFILEMVQTSAPVDYPNYKTGALAPDGNALFVATTLDQSQRASELYIFAKTDETIDSPVEFDLGGVPPGDPMTMGLVAFVHDFVPDNLPSVNAANIIYTFQGIVDFFNDGTFELFSLNQTKHIYDYAAETVTVQADMGDNSSGTYCIETDGVFSMTFVAQSIDNELDLFDADDVSGVFTIFDGATPQDAQLFAGVNLDSQASSPGRSLLLIMVPLGAGKTVTNFDRGLAGWAQGLFGHDFDYTLGDFSTYITRDTDIWYESPVTLQVEEEVAEGLAIDDDSPPATSLAGQTNTFGYTVQATGQFTVNGPSPAIEGFISEDDSVTASVDVSGTPSLNDIRLELTR